MSKFHQLLINRRSCRKFTSESLSSNDVQQILEAALLSPTSKNKRSWEFIVVENKEILEQLSQCKPHGARFIADAALAIVVLGNPLESDAWIEDAALAATNMQMQAEELHIGSCWVQIRNREYTDFISASEYIANLFEIPMPLETLCVIGFGKKEKEITPHNTDDLLWEKVHIGKYHFPQE